LLLRAYDFPTKETALAPTIMGIASTGHKIG